MTAAAGSSSDGLVVEVVEFSPHGGSADEFEHAMQFSLGLLAGADGYRGHAFGPIAERRQTYLLLVYWASLEAHVVDFRASPAGRRWREAIDPHLSVPPRVLHGLVADAGASGHVP